MVLARRILTTVIALAATLACAASPATAARAPLEKGGYIVGGFPMGDWGTVTGFALGLEGASVMHPNPEGPLGLRGELGWIYSFSRTVDVPPGNLPPNSKYTLDTSNSTLFVGVGPELGKPSGPTRPFVYGTAGFNTYWTTADLTGKVGSIPSGVSYGSSQFVFAWAAGFGIRKDIKNRPGKTIEISAEYRSGVSHSYILPEDVRSTGAVVYATSNSRAADQILVRLGMVTGHH